MDDDPVHDPGTDDVLVSRRSYLGAVGAAGAGVPELGTGSRTRHASASDDDPDSSLDRSERRKDFLWLGGNLWGRETVRENLYAFASRHDLAVVLVETVSSDGSLEASIEPAMRAASDRDLDVWLNAGLLHDVSAEAFVNDEAAREAHLDRLRSLATLHGDLFDAGRIVLWQEAPVMGRWEENGEWTQTAVRNLQEHGPAIFAAQQRVVREANDDLAVGIFPHFPYVIDSKRPEVFASLAVDLRSRDAVPDFGFVDFYRGWFEQDVGPEPANAAVRSLIANAREALEDRPVFYLGQSHTINPNHTPNRQTMRMNLRASLAAGAAGLGWYLRGGYVPTEKGFDPFVPNVPGADVGADAVNTLTVARDRALYPWLPTLQTRADFDASDAFDLWLVGDGFGFHDHRLSVRAADGTWRFVGDVGGYADGDYPDDSAATDSATVFRALDRERFLDGGVLDCRIETAAESGSAELHSALAMPCDPDAFVPERRAAELVRDGATVEESCLGRTDEPVSLASGSVRRVSVSIDRGGGANTSLAGLAYPDFADLYRRLSTFEEREGIDPAERFECWIRGDGLGNPSAVPSLRDLDGGAHRPNEVGVLATTPTLAIWYGPRRDRFLGDRGLDPVLPAESTVEAIYAMPCAGTGAFRSPDRAADLLADDPEEAARFSLDHLRPAESDGS